MTNIDTSTFVSKTDLISLKTEVVYLDADKRKTVFTEIPSASGLVTEIQFDSEKQALNKKIDDSDKKYPTLAALKEY